MMAKFALVTGAARGIGFEVARQLASGGMEVILTARKLDKASAAAEGLRREGLSVRPLAMDVSSDESVREAARQVERLDVLVNNAVAPLDFGVNALDVEWEMALAAIETTLLGSWRTVRAFQDQLKASGSGRVVNVSSGGGSFHDPEFGLLRGSDGLAAYAVAKAGLNALTVKLAAALSPFGVLVNAVTPGPTATWPGAEDEGAQPVAEGAKGIMWAATLPNDGPTGGFFHKGNPVPW
jgi:NAD(P)-dependent dehydrogenase (short-subunit alcohol dehydrogenase family)